MGTYTVENHLAQLHGASNMGVDMLNASNYLGAPGLANAAMTSYSKVDLMACLPEDPGERASAEQHMVEWEAAMSAGTSHAKYDYFYSLATRFDKVSGRIFEAIASSRLSANQVNSANTAINGLLQKGVLSMGGYDRLRNLDPQRAGSNIYYVEVIKDLTQKLTLQRLAAIGLITVE